MANHIKLSASAKEIKIGRYRHYKGQEYRVIGVAINSETMEELVIYRALYGRRLIWARPLKMFLENISLGSKIIPRFTFIGVS